MLFALVRRRFILVFVARVCLSFAFALLQVSRHHAGG